MLATEEAALAKRDTGDSRCTVNTFTRNRAFRPRGKDAGRRFLQQFQSLQSFHRQENSEASTKRISVA